LDKAHVPPAKWGGIGRIILHYHGIILIEDHKISIKSLNPFLPFLPVALGAISKAMLFLRKIGVLFLWKQPVMRLGGTGGTTFLERSSRIPPEAKNCPKSGESETIVYEWQFTVPLEHPPLWALSNRAQRGRKFMGRDRLLGMVRWQGVRKNAVKCP
jgi:hypothetical protein